MVATAERTARPDEGWAFPFGQDDLAHYYRHDLSLCGRWGYTHSAWVIVPQEQRCADCEEELNAADNAIDRSHRGSL